MYDFTDKSYIKVISNFLFLYSDEIWLLLKYQFYETMLLSLKVFFLTTYWGIEKQANRKITEDSLFLNDCSIKIARYW